MCITQSCNIELVISLRWWEMQSGKCSIKNELYFFFDDYHNNVKFNGCKNFFYDASLIHSSINFHWNDDRRLLSVAVWLKTSFFFPLYLLLNSVCIIVEWFRRKSMKTRIRSKKIEGIIEKEVIQESGRWERSQV